MSSVLIRKHFQTSPSAESSSGVIDFGEYSHISLVAKSHNIPNLILKPISIISKRWSFCSRWSKRPQGGSIDTSNVST